MSEQQNIFEMLSPEFKFPKNHTITLFEAFAGIGCQRLALKRITDNYVSLGISEIDKPALKSYEAIHNDMKNYGSICDIHELPKGIDIFTYSFPCTDLSKAGKQKGLNEQTRSGLIYEVLRVLQENKHNLPKVLIMENVVDLVQTKFIKQFNEIQLEIEKLGYSNYTFIMNAKNYGIPQNRERVFMVSILGDYYYEIPKPFELKIKLKDLLESEVDEKYYLTPKQINDISGWNTQEKPLLNMERTEKNGYSPTLTTRTGDYTSSMVLVKDSNYVGTYDYAQSNTLRPTEERRTHIGNECSGTIIASGNQNGIIVKDTIPIRNATQKGYLLAQDGDGIDISSRMEAHRGTVQKGMSLTLKTTPDVGVCVKDNNFISKKYNDFINKNGYVPNVFNPYNSQEINDLSPTLTANCGCTTSSLALLVNTNKIPPVKDNFKEYSNFYVKPRGSDGELINGSYNRIWKEESDYCGTINLTKEMEIGEKINNQLRIRKLTPRECWRLMGIYDQDFDKAKAVNSDSQLYKQAGNGIVVDVFYYILKGLIDEQ